MISHILEDDAKNIAKFFKNGKLTAAGLKVQARIYQATISEYVDKQRSAAEVSRDTAVAMRKLTAAGMSYVAASEAVGDAELAQAIAHAKNAKEINALIAAYKQAQIEAYKVNEATEEGRAKNSMDLAESRIKSLEAVSSTYQTGLDIIASKEDSINKTYDKRMKALDKVLQMNQEIADSQRDQLTMADALSKGDIFAAAKAMADQKAKDSQKSAEAQKQALTDAKDAQVAGLTATINGKQMNREEIEQRIKDINDQILVIKQNEINKHNELIARKEYEAKLDIAKAARNAPAKTSKPKASKVDGGSGGTGTGTGTKPKAAAALTPLEKKIKNFDANISKTQKLSNAVEAKLVKERKLLESYRQMGSAGAAMIPAQQKKISALAYEKSMYAKAISEYKRQKEAAIAQANARPTPSGPGRLGVNFLAGGKSPKRMGIMNHPMARGMDVMPSMIGLKEFVMSAPAVRRYGKDTMLKMNAGMLDLKSKGGQGAGSGSSKSFNPVYNINVDVAKTDAQPEEIASAVIRHLEGKNKAMMKGLIG
jgi:hypothetical protein